MDVDRLQATKLLIKRLHADYPTEGFKISPNIDFVIQSDSGVSVVAKQKINKDEILIVIPEAARLTARSILPSRLMKQLSKDIAKKSQFQELQKMLVPSEYTFAVAIMKVIGRKDSDRIDFYVGQALTWPSERMMKDTSWFYWDVSSVQQVWNQSRMFIDFEELRANVDSTFNNIIYPILLKNNPDDYIDESLPSNQDAGAAQKEKLYNTFVYSLALLWSRSHEGYDKDDDSSGVIVPIVELINGHSDRIDEVVKKGKKNETSVINVSIAHGKWPFIRGSLFRDECDLPCSAVYATRDIDEGGELIISYGDLSPTGFAFKYGCIPMDFIKHHNIMSDLSIFCDPNLIPDCSMRRKCLEKKDFPLDELKSNKKLALAHCTWPDTSLQHDMDGYETEFIASMRHFIILASCRLMEDETNRNYRTGKLRGLLYNSEAFRRLCDLFQYNIELLGGEASSADDAAKASSPDAPSWEKCCLLARIAYRESLLMWQRALSLKAKDADGNSAMLATQFGWDVRTNSDIPSLGLGCQVCGRSYPALRCGKCKSVGRQVQYCCRGHQVLGWREHKMFCGKGL